MVLHGFLPPFFPQPFSLLWPILLATLFIAEWVTFTKQVFSIKLDTLGIHGVSGFSKLPPLSLCSPCATAKSTVADSIRRSARDRDPPHPFPTLALDICDPTSTLDTFGNRYVLGVVCYTTVAIVVVHLQRKSDAPSTFTEIVATISSFGYYPSTLRIDNDSALISSTSTVICRSSSITV